MDQALSWKDDAMALSKRERARLHQMERKLRTEDPDLAVHMEQTGRPLLAQKQIIGMVLLMTTVPLCALLGLILQSLALIGAAGALMIITILAVLIQRLRRFARH